MYYSEDIVEEVRSSTNIVDLISSYVKLTKKGSSYFGLCPFHNEKTGSFSVSETKQMYYCFGCGAGGNAITFLMEYENFSFPEALKYLADKAGIKLPEKDISGEARKEADLKQTILEVNKEAARYYYAMLKSEKGAAGRRYLSGRGLSEETIKQFGLGFADKYSSGLYRYIKNKGYSDEVLMETGLFRFDEKYGMSDKFWNRVMFPIMDVNSKVVAFGGRVMGDAKPKYLNSPETKAFSKSNHLYGLHIARRNKTRKLILCEGYMDVIALHQAGFPIAVASLGTALTRGQAQLLKRYGDTVYLVYDSDAAGVKAIVRGWYILKSAGLESLVVDLKPFKDPDEFIRNRGAKAFQERLDKASSGFMFIIRNIQGSYDLRRPEEKTRFLHEAARELVKIEEEIERTTYIQAVAEEYGVSFESLRKLVASEAMRVPAPVRAEEEQAPALRKKKPEKDSSIKEAQRLLLTMLTDNPGIYPKISKYVYPEDFSEGLYREAATKLYSQLDSGKANPAAIVSCFGNEKEQQEAAALFQMKITEADQKERSRVLKEAVLRIKRYSLKIAGDNMNPADLEEMQRLIKGRKALEQLEKIDILAN